jgi:hypothetical protein
MTGFHVALFFLFDSICGLAGEEKEPRNVLTATVDMKADAGLGQTIHIVASRTSLDLHCGVPQAAVPFEAGTGLVLHNAVTFEGVAAIEPDRRMGSTVVFWYAEGGHGISRHAREAVPLPVHVVVTQRCALRLIKLVLSVPPGFIQADVSRTGI